MEYIVLQSKQEITLKDVNNMKLKDIIFKKKRDLEVDELIEEIRETERQLVNIEKCFGNVSDDNLIDACIYQRESLCARYRYLLGKARAQTIINQPFSNDAL